MGDPHPHRMATDRQNQLNILVLRWLAYNPDARNSGEILETEAGRNCGNLSSEELASAVRDLLRKGLIVAAESSDGGHLFPRITMDGKSFLVLETGPPAQSESDE